MLSFKKGYLKMVKLKIVSSNDFLSPANVAIKAEGELLRQKAKIALMDSVSDLM